MMDTRPYPTASAVNTTANVKMNEEMMKNMNSLSDPRGI